MSSATVLLDAFGRIGDWVGQTVQGLSVEDLSCEVEPGTNSIGWLVWHLSRVQDDHVAAVTGDEQVWTASGWVDRFALPFERHATGYGQSADEVALVRVSADLLTGYLEAVTAVTERYVATLSDEDMARVVDTRWDPPVTLGVRLMSIVCDDLAHIGQAQLVRGILERRGS